MKLLYQRNPTDVKINPEAGKIFFDGLCSKFGTEPVRRDPYKQRGGPPDFPVLMHDNRIESSLAVSQTLQHLPIVAVDDVFIDRPILAEARGWLERKRKTLLKATAEEEENG